MVCMPSYFFFLSFLLYTTRITAMLCWRSRIKMLSVLCFISMTFAWFAKEQKCSVCFFPRFCTMAVAGSGVFVACAVCFLSTRCIRDGWCAKYDVHIRDFVCWRTFLLFFWRIFGTVSFIRESSLRSVIFMVFFLFLLRIRIANSQLSESFVLFSPFFLFLHLVNFVLTERSGKWYSYQTIDTLLKRIYWWICSMSPILSATSNDLLDFSCSFNYKSRSDHLYLLVYNEH